MDSLTTLNTYAATSVPYTDESAGSATLTNRYQINGVIDTNQSVIENLERVCSAAGSWLSYDVAAGQWGVVINRSGASVSSFSNSNIIGSISVSGSGLKDLYNAVRVEFPNRDVRDASDFVKIELPAGEKNSNELPNTLNLAYDIINEPVQAQLLGFIELKQSRVDLLITFETDYSKISLKAGDLIDVTNTQFGFSAKVFRIISIAEKQGDGPITLEITALEYDAGVYTTTDLTRFVRSDSTGIITIGSIGTPGTPSITKFEVDSRPRIVITSTAPTGIVEAMEFWRTTDTALSESARSYNLIGTQRPVGGGTYSSGQSVTLEFDTLNASNFLIKTRGINEFTVGNFSGVSGLIEYVPQQITDGIDENTKIYDALTQAATGFAINFALKKLDELLGGTAGSLWERIAQLLRDYGIPVPVTPPAPGAPPALSEPISVQTGSSTLTTNLEILRFTGDGVTVTNPSTGLIIANIPGGGAGGGNGSIDTSVRKPNRGDTIAYTGGHNGKWVPVPPCCDQTANLATDFPAYVERPRKNFLLLQIESTLPPDRSTFADSQTNFSANTDKAPITGSYYVKFNTGGGDGFYSQPLYGSITKGSGVARIFASDGTELGSGVDIADCTIVNNRVLEIPFPTRALKTDYFVTLPQGFVKYCDALSQAVVGPRLIPDNSEDANTYYLSDDKKETTWNFNTPVRASLATPYTPIAASVSAPIVGTAPVVSSFKVAKTFKRFRDRSDQKYPGTTQASVEPVVIADIKTYIAQNYSAEYVEEDGVLKATGGPGLENATSELTFTLEEDSSPMCGAGTLALTFSTNVRVGTGNIRIYRLSDQVLRKTIDAATGVVATGISASGALNANNTIIYEALTGLEPGFTYYINADAGIAQNNGTGDCYNSGVSPSTALTGNSLQFSYAPVFDLSSFTVKDTFGVTGNGNNRTDVHTEIRLIFNTTFKDGYNDLSGFGSSGTITIYKSDGSVHQTFNLADRLSNSPFTNELLKIESDNTVVINPTTDFDFDTTYYVLYDAGVVISKCLTNCPALSDTSRVRFKTEAGPQTPAIALNSTNSVNETGLNLPFDRKVEAGSGLLKVIDVSTGTEVASVPATDPAVTFNNYTDGA